MLMKHFTNDSYFQSISATTNAKNNAMEALQNSMLCGNRSLGSYAIKGIRGHPM